MSLIFLLLLIHSFEDVSRAESATLCTSNACFTLHLNGMNFEGSRQSCIDNGGYLMTVRDREEEDVLRSVLSQIQRQQQDGPLIFWIGLKLHKGDCVVAGQTLRGFKWVSGEENSRYSNWDKEPGSTCTKERCVRVHHTLSGENQLKWTAGSCKSSAFYVCKFYFKGMCKPLALLGPGEITYIAPFSNEPQKTKMQSFPLGTFAEILCSDQKKHYSVCKGVDNVYRWNEPGPFCVRAEENCAINNGGCEHLCHQEMDRIRCSCKKDYNLDQNGFTCRIKNLCGPDTCEHQCIMEESGYSCKCPAGFRLDANRRDCSDIDECESQVCESQLCVNTLGSYTCACKDGYGWVDGKCSDVDECTQSGCEHGCSNSIGSFSCFCRRGFTLSEDARSCVDINECVSSRCEYKCVNTDGSFVCICPEGSHLESDGLTCASATPIDDPTDEETPENFTESLTRTTVELQHQSPHTDTPLPDLVNVTNGDQQSNTSLVTSFAKTINSKVMICVLGSVIPLLLLLAVTMAIAIFRCSRSKKEAKKNTTTDGYCWVSSGLDPRLEKLYESILTDDL